MISGGRRFSKGKARFGSSEATYVPANLAPERLPDNAVHLPAPLPMAA